jgi:hypothetical protein
MKILLLIVVAWGIMGLGSANAADRAVLWQRVEDALKKGLPRTAITNLDLILPDALRDKAYAEAAKALTRKVSLEAGLQGDKAEQAIVRLESAISGAPTELKPILETVLARWYWQYYQQNRWRFLQRTQSSSAPGKDFTTWDLPRILAKVDELFTLALAKADQLKKIPVNQFDDFLTAGTMPDRYRPTLYDFLAQEALSFYSAGEQGASQPEDAFELKSDSPIFEPADTFLKWAPAATNGVAGTAPSLSLKAIRLYQDLLQFHLKDADPTALLDANLARLVWGNNVATGEDKAPRFKAALQQFVNQWADYEVSALALYYWARATKDSDDWIEARRLALRGAQAHAESVGGKLCRNLVNEIETKSSRIETESVWKAPNSKITVHYRNVTSVFFRAIKTDWEAFTLRPNSATRNLRDQLRETIRGTPPAKSWNQALAPTSDYQTRVQELDCPSDLAPGFYLIAASSDSAFDDRDNEVSYATVWVSNLALVLRPRAGREEGFVLDAGSGEPAAGAQVKSWFRDAKGEWNPAPNVVTDENGFFTQSQGERPAQLFRAEFHGQEVALQDDMWSVAAIPPDSTEVRTVFFTDRSLYRPGQSIHFKGLCLQANQGIDQYRVLSGKKLTIVFEDTNGKEVARADQVCNDYGSFSGVFTAPRDRLRGQMRIHSPGIQGDTYISVEEYKRPKFQVSIAPPKTAPRLNDRVNLTGKAEAYTGAAIDAAQVKWRVVREVRWPGWWFWRRGINPGSPSQEIAHGTIRTGSDGNFELSFITRPDPKVSEKDEAAFTFRIYADVTDQAGETRSTEQTIQVGFVALRAELSIAEWQTISKPVMLDIHTSTLDGTPQTAEGVVRVYQLKQPGQVQPARLAGPVWRGEKREPGESPDLSDPRTWDLGDLAAEKGFTTDVAGKAELTFPLSAGPYRVILETQDRFGKKVTSQDQVQVLDPDAPKFETKLAHLLVAPNWVVQPGDEFTALWATGYDPGRAFIEIEHRHQLLERYWTQPGRTQQAIKRVITEALRGGFTVHVTQVHDNRAYSESRRIDVPWRNKDLELNWEHWTSKLQPGQKETWTLAISKSKANGPLSPTNKPADVERVAAELVATLYDASLDQFQPFAWMHHLEVFRQDYSTARLSFANRQTSLIGIFGQFTSPRVPVVIRYRHFPNDVFQDDNVRYMLGNTRRFGRGVALEEAMPATPMAAMASDESAKGAGALPTALMRASKAMAADSLAGAEGEAAAGAPAKPAPKIAPESVAARRNLNETAFFFPQLLSDSNGIVRLQFTMPEALTSWRFMGFAHDRNLRSGFIEGQAVTAKDLMVQPNPPRFLREGDELEFSVKVSNQSDSAQQGKIRLQFRQAFNDQPADALLSHQRTEQPFEVPAKQSRSYSWRLRVSDGTPFLIYQALASNGAMSDGEEGYLAVLPRRELVTESLLLPIRGPATNHYTMKKLAESDRSSSLRSLSLVVQMVSNPAWYAVMALPYLMEFPYECNEQTFNRFYANALARFLANSDPKIRRTFNLWKNTPALDSPLEKNQDLKAVALEETPWLRNAQQENQARKNVGLLFDENQLSYSLDAALTKLTQNQMDDGSWPWFPGGPGNDYITLYITTGFGRLRHLGIDVQITPAIRALNRLDEWIARRHRECLKLTEPEKYLPSSTECLYLYSRSFFLKDRPIAKPYQEAIAFFLGQARTRWAEINGRQSQAHLALALQRWKGDDNVAAAKAIMRSLKERSVTDSELGRFWRDTEFSWWWYHAPIETQALMIEAFDEVAGDATAVDECQTWLLKQKQTQNWKTTKATADAVYALLLRGRNLLASDKLVEVILGDQNVTPNQTPAENQPTKSRTPRPSSKSAAATPDSPAVEPGTGFYERRFTADAISPKLARITVRKSDAGVAWGSVNWQYLEDIRKITPYENTPLKLKKDLFTKVNSARGPVLEPVKGALAVGDELVTRLELRVDRDLEYVHLKDERGSGTEPINVLSQYKFQDGLAYYESTRDTASHFFIDYLPKGVYVFEYSSRIQHRGQYQSGLASIQCMYAPEFNSHSESFSLQVK